MTLPLLLLECGTTGVQPHLVMSRILQKNSANSVNEQMCFPVSSLVNGVV